MTNRDGPQQPRELSAADKSHLGAALREQRQFRVEQLAELAEEERRGGTPSSSLEVTAAALCMACQRRADYSSPSEPILAGGSARRTE
jgi:hypothetical protein